jgi:hypothetical protein
MCFFDRHLKLKHLTKFKEYQESKSAPTSPHHTPITQYFPSSSDLLYSTNHPRQQLLTKSLVENVIVQCGVPMSFVESKGFREFMHVVDSKYVPPSRKSVTQTILPSLLENKIKLINEIVSDSSDIALTIDIWTDRCQHSFIGITAHIFSLETTEVSSYLITFKQFQGSHTGHAIASEIENTLCVYNLNSKVHFIVTDNASNMKKALSFVFPSHNILQETEGNILDDSDDLDDPSLFNDFSADILDAAIPFGERIPCFAHSLQLVIRDALRSTNTFSKAIAKCSKLANLVHQSTSFREAFEGVFGKTKSIPSTNDTRL